MPGKESEERRLHPRSPRKFSLKFRIVQGPLPADVGYRVGHVRNISRGGVLLTSLHALPSGVVVELKIPENVLGEARTLFGKVRWMKSVPASEKYNAGMMFVQTPILMAVKGTGVAKSSVEKGEKRRGPRFPRKLLLKVQCISKGLFHETTGRAAYLANISRGGAEMSTTCEYAPGSILEVHFPESPLGPARMLCAKVLWTRPAERPGHHRIGVMFVRGPRRPEKNAITE